MARQRGRPKKRSYVAAVTLGEAFQAFVDEKRADGVRQCTIDNYMVAFSYFTQLIGHDTPAAQFTIQDYRVFLTALQTDERKNEVSVRTYVRNLRVYLHWIMKEGYCPAFGIPLPRAQTSAKVLYTDEELRRLLKKPEKDCLQTEYLGWIVTNLVLSTGIRLRSVQNLKVSDVGRDTLAVNVTKNRRALLLPLNPDCARILRTYIKLFGLESTDYLFCRADGQAYASASLQTIFKRYCGLRGVEKTSIHLLRHSFASAFYLQTRDILALSRILGHSGTGVTENYLRSLGVCQITERLREWNPQKEYGTAPRQRRGKMKKG